MFHANFRDGSLYLGCKRGILRIDSVPAVRASKFDLKSRQGPVWQECFPRLKLDRLFRVIDVLGLLDNWDSWTCSTGRVQRHWAAPDTWATVEACLEFLRSANLPLCRRIAALGQMHFTVLFYATRLPLLGRLLESNRGLAFALIAAAVRLRSEPQQGLDLLRNLLRKREAEHCQRRLAFHRALGGCSSESRPERCTCSRLERFRQCVWQPTKVRISRHLPRFGPSVIEILAHRPAANGGLVRIDNRFLCEVAEQESATARTATIASRLFALIAARNRYFPGTPLCVTSMEQWKRLCERYFPHSNVRTLKMLRTMMFPPAPIQGDTCIHPIKSGEELIHESTVQRNCSLTMFEERCGGREILLSGRREGRLSALHGGIVA